MFTNQHHLRHLLRPDQYVSVEQHRAELRHVFQPAWHPLATIHDLAKPGDFLSFELFETPILMRNCDGEVCAFLNVCPHRHSNLTSAARGHSEKFRCQYHGWEFNKDGRTGKIPHAKAFRPWDRDHSCLRKFRVERCGEIVFVCVDDSAPSLREWLGPLWERWEPAFSGNFRYTTTWEGDFACNWKVVLENSLESYHIPQIHPTTFKEYPPEENAWHELDPRFTTFKTVIPNTWQTRIQNWLARRLGGTLTKVYWHHNKHPHITFASLDVNNLMMCVFPTSPTTCRYRSILFTLRGQRRTPLAWAVYQFLRPIVIYVAKKVFNEDAGIYRAVQKGLEASPHAGVIGTREERLYTFQEFVINSCRGAKELPQVSENTLPNGNTQHACSG